MISRLAVNLGGAMLCIKHAAPLLKLTRGAIVNLTSLGVRPGRSDYVASKWALRGLTQAAVLMPTPGREPSAREVARVVELIRSRGIRAVFAEVQHPAGVAELVARETGAALVILDPLGGVPGRETYLELMRFDVARMEEALR